MFLFPLLFFFFLIYFMIFCQFDAGTEKFQSSCVTMISGLGQIILFLVETEPLSERQQYTSYAQHTKKATSITNTRVMPFAMNIYESISSQIIADKCNQFFCFTTSQVLHFICSSAYFQPLSVPAFVIKNVKYKWYRHQTHPLAYLYILIPLRVSLIFIDIH